MSSLFFKIYASIKKDAELCRAAGEGGIGDGFAYLKERIFDFIYYHFHLKKSDVFEITKFEESKQ